MRSGQLRIKERPPSTVATHQEPIDNLLKGVRCAAPTWRLVATLALDAWRVSLLRCSRYLFLGREKTLEQANGVASSCGDVLGGPACERQSH